MKIRDILNTLDIISEAPAATNAATLKAAQDAAAAGNTGAASPTSQTFPIDAKGRQTAAADPRVIKQSGGAAQPAKTLPPPDQKLMARQKELIAAGANIKADGRPGPATTKAETEFGYKTNKAPTATGPGSAAPPKATDAASLAAAQGKAPPAPEAPQAGTTGANQSQPEPAGPAQSAMNQASAAFQPGGDQAAQPAAAPAAPAANNGIQAQAVNPVKTGSGGTLTDRSGNPVMSGSQTKLPDGTVVSTYDIKNGQAFKDKEGKDYVAKINPMSKQVEFQRSFSGVGSWIDAMKGKAPAGQGAQPTAAAPAAAPPQQATMESTTFANDDLSRIVSLIRYR